MSVHLHPDDCADQRNGVDLMRQHVSPRHVATAAAVIYLGTLSWIGHVAWLIQWAGN